MNSSSLLGLRPDCHPRTGKTLAGRPALGMLLPRWGKQQGIAACVLTATTMRDRAKNRKQTQRGRYLSIEAIQAVQALKRAGGLIGGGCGGALESVLASKVRRLIKGDMVAVLRELLTQGEGLLALQILIELVSVAEEKQLFLMSSSPKLISTSDTPPYVSLGENDEEKETIDNLMEKIKALEAEYKILKKDIKLFQGTLLQQHISPKEEKVFEEVRKEHWYKPQLSLYNDMIKVLASCSLFEKVELVFSCLKTEHLNADTEGFNALLMTFFNFGYIQFAMDCFRLMKLWESEPDESTYAILISGLKARGETELCILVKQEAEQHCGESLDFLEQNKEVMMTGYDNVCLDPELSTHEELH